MTTPKLPALDPASVAELRGSGYPEPFRSRMGDRMKKKLGDACGLSQFGVNLVTLGPGAQSALRHWHTHEDEFIYVLAGEVTLVTDAGEQVLRAGQCAGYPAGAQDAHHFVNRSKAPAQYLEVGSRIAEDIAHYPDDDLAWRKAEARSADGYRSTLIAAHKDGKPY
ncbi:MAG TPA: cupin domain-containing protein [Solimonas sp.]|nr:cupin domain-containing protein [Solimonas sp.]